ncbi:MAG: competence/damage-inducible protein A [Candidatus Firestonebacteria bacterium]
MASVEIVSIGTELLLGQILDTNSTYISQKLAEIGVDVFFKSSVGDNETRIENCIRQAFERADIIIVTGGLGPTVDDVTKNAVVKVLGKRLFLNEKILEKIKNNFKHRGVSMPESNVSQAMIPHGAIIIDNELGTAPGLLINHNSKIIILLPGVPREMKAMIENNVLPYIKKHYHSDKSEIIKSKVLKVFGMGESMVDAKILDIFKSSSNPSIALLADTTEVKIRLTAKAKDEIFALKLIAPLEKDIRNRLRDSIFAVDDETMEYVVAKLLLQSKLTISVAESHTGGFISHKLTNIPDSSKYFKRGIIAYSDESKVELLKVSPEAIRLFGAVSKQVADAMADGVRRIANTDIGLAVTGIAGPSGEREGKPVGLVYIAMAWKDSSICDEYKLKGDRILIKEQTAQLALDVLRRYLLKMQNVK